MNNGQIHFFLGDPFSYGRDKTVVERGCTFSPGLWSVGISLAVQNGKWIAPETVELPLAFENNIPPIAESYYPAGEGVFVHCRLCTLGGKYERTCDYFDATIEGNPQACCLMVRDIGPAGAKIEQLQWREQAHCLVVNQDLEIHIETLIEHVDLLPADDTFDSPCAFIYFRGKICLRVLHSYNHILPCPAFSTDQAFIQARLRWQAAMPARIFTPDERINHLWEQTAFHMLSAMECGLPRIGVENYPILWIRDCIVVLRCLDTMGRSELARIGYEALADTLFCGGFGCESDNPGEGIWALVGHAKITKDFAWLEAVYPTIERRVLWIRRMLEASEPLMRPGDSRTPYALSRESSVCLCYAHQGGHIHGRMDWHSPDFYINCWAYAGLNHAAEAASLLHHKQESQQWYEMAQALRLELQEVLLPQFGNERDGCAVPYPTQALPANLAQLQERFGTWYRQARLTSTSERIPEPLWTYFEAAQIHNAILLGFQEEAWTSLDDFLNDPRWLGMGLMHEGEPCGAECLPFGKSNQARGWLHNGALGGNMPHNWATGETFLLLRSLLVEEEPDGLLLLAGVPEAWKKSGQTIQVRNWPTNFGMLSFDAKPTPQGSWQVTLLCNHEIPYRIAQLK